MGETLDRARRLMEALSDRDLEEMLELSDPAVEWHSFFAELGESGVYRGTEGTRQYLSDLGEAWEIVRADIADGLQVGDVAVLVGHIHYRGKGSGIETESPAGWVLRFSGGKLTYFKAFRDPEQTLAELGGGRRPAPA